MRADGTLTDPSGRHTTVKIKTPHKVTFSFLSWRAQKDSLGILCLRANRNDLAAFYLPNLLVFEPSGRVLIPVVPTVKIKTPHKVTFSFLSWRAQKDSNPQPFDP